MVRGWRRRGNDRVQLHDLAAAAGISVKTAREFETLGLIGSSSEISNDETPASEGYGPGDLARLTLVARAKPARVPVDQIRDMAAIVTELSGPGSVARRAGLIARWRTHLSEAEEQCADLRARLIAVEALADHLRAEYHRLRDPDHDGR